MVGLPRSWLASTYCRSCAFSAPVPSSTFLLWLRARLARPLRGDVVEASTVAVEHRLLASKLLPALHRNIDISRRDFNRVAHAAGHLSRAASFCFKPIGARAVGKVVNDHRADWRKACY